MPLTDQGFTPKTLDELKENISSNLKITLGSDIDVSPSSRIGQFIDIVSNELFSSWQGMQDIYNSFYPNTASGTSLDNVASITNTIRLFATQASGAVYYVGSAPLTIPLGHLIAKEDTTNNFQTTAESTIVDTANLIVSSKTATSGSITLSWDNTSIAPIIFNDNEASITSKIQNHPGITEVTVVGTLSSQSGFHVTFVNDTLTSRLPTVEDNSLQRDALDLTVLAGYSNSSEVPVNAESSGALSVPATSIRDIVTPIVNLEGVVNFEIGTSGRNRETDAQLRERMAEELQRQGTTTAGGMREAVANVSNVSNVTIVENDTSLTDSAGRPPHSVEVYVTGGNDNDVAQAIYNSKPVGIGIVATSSGPELRTGNYIDVNTDPDTLSFSAPTGVPIQVQIEITTNSDYPTDGEQQLKDKIIRYFSDFVLGQDVLNHQLYTPANEVAGIQTMTITNSKVGGSLGTATVTIDANEIATCVDGDVTIVEN